MKKQNLAICLGAWTIVVLFGVGPSVGAGSPMEEVRVTVDNVVSTLQNPDLKSEAKRAVRRSQLKEIIYAKFDFAEMAKRSLGSQWQNRTPDEQREFTAAFSRLLEDTYLDQIDSYKSEKVQYLREKQDDGFAEVNTKIVNKKGEEFAIDYRLHRPNGDWKVYDVVIENISLVNNYRSQFSRFLSRSSFEELLRAVNDKKLARPAT